MVGLGTMFIAVMGLSALLLWRKKLFETKWMLWLLMLSAVPVHRQYRGMDDGGDRTSAVAGVWPDAHVDGYSKMVSAGNGWFS